MITVTFDGYDFAERILEGVIFEADIEDSKVKAVRITKLSEGEYWGGLNKAKWLKAAKLHAVTCLADSDGNVEQAISDGLFNQPIPQ